MDKEAKNPQLVNKDDIRLDKWLKIARFFKKREEAAEAVENGQVKLNGERVKPARHIKPGDSITIRKDARTRSYTIKIATDKSVSAAVARDFLYEAHPLNEAELEAEEMLKLMNTHIKENKKVWRESHDDKKKRRDLNRFKYGED